MGKLGDPVTRIAYFLLAGTRKSPERVAIVRLLQKNPSSAEKISVQLNLDRDKINQNLKILEENKLVISRKNTKAEKLYFLSDYLESNRSVLEDLWSKRVSEPV